MCLQQLYFNMCGFASHTHTHTGKYPVTQMHLSWHYKQILNVFNVYQQQQKKLFAFCKTKPNPMKKWQVSHVFCRTQLALDPPHILHPCHACRKRNKTGHIQQCSVVVLSPQRVCVSVRLPCLATSLSQNADLQLLLLAQRQNTKTFCVLCNLIPTFCWGFPPIENVFVWATL